MPVALVGKPVTLPEAPFDPKKSRLVMLAKKVPEIAIDTNDGQRVLSFGSPLPALFRVAGKPKTFVIARMHGPVQQIGKAAPLLEAKEWSLFSGLPSKGVGIARMNPPGRNMLFLGTLSGIVYGPTPKTGASVTYHHATEKPKPRLYATRNLSCLVAMGGALHIEYGPQNAAWLVA